ncbi:MAG: acetylglutamate kinase, partial [Clostridia bacterium]|nr:acetylglutamate kinase [Clostridia bacterium]
VNKALVNLIQSKGGNAVGLSGIDGGMIQAKMLDEKYGYVGEITDVNVSPILDMLSHGYIPVVSTVGCDREGNVYNVNADTAAARIAGALHAERLITLTDIVGLLRDVSDPNSLISNIHIAEAEAMIESGAISGGMIPKIKCCIDAIYHGVEKVIILDGRVPHAILLEMLTNEGAGTMVSELEER